ncbi:hypothetical protein Acr_00g0093450 [Actinidia rufa]|uniref:Uncharacterized protein n=1 Tax=Actinidia rufa TaxID=165716 RepID=A0A7J0DY40_9ERIC|nr:hypothetical protein Acr_00g0093450 [Actinidia rufa]
MSRRIDLGKLAKMSKGSKVSIPKRSKTATPTAKGVVIRKKVLRMRSLTSRPARRLLEGVIPPFDQEEVGKLDLEKLVYVVGQVVVLASSLVEHDRELRDGAMT